MKTLFSLLFTFFVIIGVYCQTNSKYYRELPVNTLLIPLEVIYPNYTINEVVTPEIILVHLLKIIPQQFQSEFKLVQEVKNPYATHYLFQQYINHQKVYNTCIKVNLDNKQKIYSIYYALVDVSSKKQYFTNSITYINTAENSYDPTWVYQNNELKEAIINRHKDVNNNSYIENILINNELIQSTDLNSYFAPHDTLINGYIYNPDPLTAGNNVYGGSLIDNSDTASTYLNSKRVLVSVRATDTLGIFYLKSPYCEIVEIDPPIKNPVNSINDNFLFTRYDDGFEDFNAYYHINHFHEYISDSLGYALVNYPIQCDVHAIGGADNSFFTFSTTPPSLHMGEGGVDDAEDADVIIHEYCHAVSNDAAPFTNVGTERISLDEGFCDYLACSYSNSINPFHANWVFNWDGHNQFWNGRFVDNTKIYPTDITADIYNNGGIWSSALWEIEPKIGREKGNKLAIQTMYDNAPNMTLNQAAINYIYADTLLYAGADYCKIVHSFILRGLLPASYGVNCDFTGIVKPKHTIFEIYNSIGFAYGTGDLVIRVADITAATQLQLIDMQGHLVYQTAIQNNISMLPSISMAAGVYTLILNNNNTVNTFKLIKY